MEVGRMNIKGTVVEMHSVKRESVAAMTYSPKALESLLLECTIREGCPNEAMFIKQQIYINDYEGFHQWSNAQLVCDNTKAIDTILSGIESGSLDLLVELLEREQVCHVRWQMPEGTHFGILLDAFGLERVKFYWLVVVM